MCSGFWQLEAFAKETTPTNSSSCSTGRPPLNTSGEMLKRSACGEGSMEDSKGCAATNEAGEVRIRCLYRTRIAIA